MTLLDRLVEDLRTRALAHDGNERPAAVLWPDARRDFVPVTDLLLARMPELLVLGPHAPSGRTGPTIWMRCVVDGALDVPQLPSGVVPVLYLPGIDRHDLRAGDGCPDPLKPLVELLYRGSSWIQNNGSDWTLSAFLTSSRALGLDVARDVATLEAAARALRELGLAPLEPLRGRQLQADDFDRLLSPDTVRDLLRWMGDPDGVRGRFSAAGWEAFCARCSAELDFDPREEDVAEAARFMADGTGAWSGVWQRFTESPSSYRPLADVLRKCRVPGTLPFDRDRWADLNEEDERALKSSLEAVFRLEHGAACERIAQLEAEHGSRRSTPWAALGLAPLARALQPLSRLAETVKRGLAHGTLEDAARDYSERGWKADAAAWEALASVPVDHEKTIGLVTRHLLLPWTDDGARGLQQVMARSAPPAEEAPDPGTGGCLVFVDGLRFDLGQRLAERLETRGCRTTVSTRWAALPTVTATAKPAVSPVAAGIRGTRLDETFTPALEGRLTTARELRDAITRMGWQVVDHAAPSPQSESIRGWMEAGDIDTIGHRSGARLARQLDDELARLCAAVLRLLDAGWKRVRLVTDHGFLLIPEGTPRAELPRHLTVQRWARCAVIADGAAPDVLRLPWRWNPAAWFAVAPGAACFNKSDEYAHGGVSVQECVTPEILVERAAPTAPPVTIRSVTWRGLRCYVEVDTTGSLLADLRLQRASGASVVVEAKAVAADGSASLLLAGDEHEHAALVLVLVDGSGRIIAQRPTRAGENS